MKYILPLEDGKWELREDEYDPKPEAIEVSLEEYSGLSEGTLTYMNGVICTTN